MKDKRYKRIKNQIIAGASSGIMAGMLIIGGANTAYAESVDYSVPAYSQNTSSVGMHAMRRWNSSTKISALTTSLGLDKDKVAEEIKSGKNLKQILQENGIVPEQIQKAFTHKKNTKGWRKNVI
ncbi:MAG: hypothetical protein AB198_02005 [Parcubacteria bacterium C7867-003]|nr:MAG: hypothetical protein AB198_02005 [Parcubacteria bacterium C7867-003]